MLQLFITHLRDLLCHAMKHFYFSNEPAKYVNLNYTYMCIPETSKRFLGMLLKNNPEDGQLGRTPWAKRARGKIKQCCTLLPSTWEMLQKHDWEIWKEAPARSNLSHKTPPTIFCVELKLPDSLGEGFKIWQQLHSQARAVVLSVLCQILQDHWSEVIS